MFPKWISCSRVFVIYNKPLAAKADMHTGNNKKAQLKHCDLLQDLENCLYLRQDKNKVAVV